MDGGSLFEELQEVRDMQFKHLEAPIVLCFLVKQFNMNGRKCFMYSEYIWDWKIYPDI